MNTYGSTGGVKAPSDVALKNAATQRAYQKSPWFKAGGKTPASHKEPKLPKVASPVEREQYR